MILSVLSHSGEPMPGVGGSAKRAGRESENVLTELFSRASMSGTGRFDVADFSVAAEMLSEPLLVPTVQNVRELSAELSAKLSRIFDRTGLCNSTPVEFRVDPSTGAISAAGSCSEPQRIEEIVNNDPELKKLFHTINAVSTHTYAIPQHLKFQREYLASDHPDQVLEKYASLFGPESDHDFAMSFDGSTIRMVVDGRVSNPSRAPSNSIHQAQSAFSGR